VLDSEIGKTACEVCRNGRYLEMFDEGGYDAEGNEVKPAKGYMISKGYPGGFKDGFKTNSAGEGGAIAPGHQHNTGIGGWGVGSDPVAHPETVGWVHSDDAVGFLDIRHGWVNEEGWFKAKLPVLNDHCIDCTLDCFNGGLTYGDEEPPFCQPEDECYGVLGGPQVRGPRVDYHTATPSTTLPHYASRYVPSYATATRLRYVIPPT
jgi:hypothetical protein